MPRDGAIILSDLTVLNALGVIADAASVAPGRRRRSGPGHMIGIPSSLGLTTPFPFLSKGDSV
jgi:hypothetical protein